MKPNPNTGEMVESDSCDTHQRHNRAFRL